MKPDEVPQDGDELFEGKTTELLYTLDEEGAYSATKSKGWSVKNEISRQAWEALKEEVEEALTLVKSGERSPLYFYMKRHLMDASILAQYMGILSFRVKRHMKPKVYQKLSEKMLNRYCGVFGLSDVALLSSIEHMEAEFENLCDTPILS